MSPQAVDRINAEFLQKVLKKSTNDNSLEVKSIATECATAKGDNYLSDIIRATVEYTHNHGVRKVTKNVSLIFKLALTSAESKKMLSESGVFDTEIKMMETTLGKMNNMLNEEGCRLSARVLYTENSASPFLVLEDLTPLGYRLTDRHTGLDLDHCSLVMRKLAMFHASSVALWEKDPQLITSYKKGMFHKEGCDYIEKLFRDALRVLGNQIRNCPELGNSGPSYSDKILKSSKDCYETATKLIKPKDGAFNVLVHGDVWVNNLLFRYNKDGQVDDLIFVDFQMSVWSSPALDIVYFLSNGPTENVEVHHIDDLLEEYLNVLTKTMSKLGCRTKSISMLELRRSLKELEFVGILRGALTIHQMSQIGDSCVSLVFENPAFLRRMMRRLISANNHGVFDV